MKCVIVVYLPLSGSALLMLRMGLWVAISPCTQLITPRVRS